VLEVRNIHKRYEMGDEIVYALRGVSLTIEQGDFVAIMGPSGSGKSTLMHVLGLLDVPDEGSYQLNGREVAQLDENELAVLRREVIGFIFQQFNLLPRMSAAENVALPLIYSERKTDLDRAKALLEQVGLGTRMFHRPNELSGGQQQRVAIARSLINNPLMIFADEPTGNLDSKSEKDIMAALKQLNESGITIVIVTHEEEIGQQAKRLIRMRDGAVQSDERLVPMHGAEAQTARPAHDRGRHSLLLDVAQHVRLGIKTLVANKIRTGLSMLGILIGVAAVVAMLALGRGAQQAIADQLSSLGSNLLVLRAGNVRGAGGVMMDSGAAVRLLPEDAELIRNIPAIKEVASNVNGRAQVTFGNKNWSTSVLGASASYARMRAAQPTIGRFFTDEENRMRARVAVIGMTLVRELFDGKNPLGEMIKINRINFQIIGVLPEKGASSWRDQDDIVVVPVMSAMYRLLGRNHVDYIDIEVSDPKRTQDVSDRVLDTMLRRKNVPLSQREDALQIRNMADLQAALSESTRVMTMLLSVIASISLLVGGIGIMNIMLVSVTERTREIGLRKAVGATRGDILSQFLVESVVISVIGGLFGVALAWLITIGLAKVAGWNASISASSVLLACFFSMGVGIVFGIYPARKASLLAPIDALRHE
jgi:macrolide transport system ATP-binding/permease protein